LVIFTDYVEQADEHIQRFFVGNRRVKMVMRSGIGTREVVRQDMEEFERAFPVGILE
jgi:hypothetical protein